MSGKKHRKHRHQQAPLPPRGPGLEQILDQADALWVQGKLDQALEVLENAPLHLRRRLEILLPRGVIYLAKGNTGAAVEVFEDARRIEPSNPIVAFFLATAYYDIDWVGHAAQAIRQALGGPYVIPRPMQSSAEALRQEIATIIQGAAAELGATADTVEEAFLRSEQAERLSNEERFAEAADLFHQAADLLPTWDSPRNNEALMRFLDGEVEQAISISQEVLSRDRDNRHALANLVRFRMARSEREQAEAYGERLKQLPCNDDSDLTKTIEALGILGDDQGLLDLYRQYMPLLNNLNALRLLVLGSAAANVGQPVTARRLWRMAKDRGMPGPVVARLETALRRNAPGPGYAQRYPTAIPPMLISIRQYRELTELATAWEKGEIDEQTARRRLADLAARNPHLIQVVTSILWEEADPELGLQMLAWLGTPAALAEIERFAFSQAGPMDWRLQAARMLAEQGVLDLSQPVKMWDEENQEWCLLRMAEWHIVPEMEPPAYSPEVWELIEAGTKAIRNGQLELGREKLEAALALDSQAAIAHYYLAAALQREGDVSGAVEHLHRALEIDPLFVHARCSLARCHLLQDDLDAAREVLQPLSDRGVLTLQEVRYYQRTLVELALHAKDFATARRQLEIALEWFPEDQTLHDLLQQVRMFEALSSPFWEEWRARERRHEQRKRRRSTRTDATLVECLARLTKGALVGTARAIMPSPRPYNVRKEVLIQDLARYLANADHLAKIIDGLADSEQQALREVLEAGGTLSWETFTARWGDDLDESPDWQWHEPETVMGHLRMLGLLSEGTVDLELLVLIPYELRPLLAPLLGLEVGQEGRR